MASLKVLPCLQWATFIVCYLMAPLAFGAPASVENQYIIKPVDSGHHPSSHIASHRGLHGRFLHITDLHPDDHYKPHTSTEESIACHRGDGPAGVYGAETSDCDSPLSLVNATLNWVRENLRDEIDFVVWTGDSARHDSDEEIPRHNHDILTMNDQISKAFVDTFSDGNGMVIPVVPTFGNNDIYPHNILMPGPNDILKTYSNIWKPFIPDTQRHSFEFGGWFYVEVIPHKLAVFSLNTMYFFDRNAGVDDCVHPSEPGFKHFEWLHVQLDYLRSRNMKAILIGHVPPARTEGKQLWDETCWQKYTLWLQQYRDVIVGSLYGHMNIDHFLLQDTKDLEFKTSDTSKPATRKTMEDDFSVQSSSDYLKELRDRWAKLPDPIALGKDVEGTKKKKGKKGKDKLGGPWAERYQLTLISPSIVPNYFPSLRVFEYNITGLETSPAWVDNLRASTANEVVSHDETPEVQELKRRQTPDFETEKKKDKKGKKGKKPGDPYLHVPDPPARGTPPGPAYYPQTLTLLGYTQYFANLTHLNNDIVVETDLSSSSWRPGKHRGKTPQPREFGFEVEYSTFDDKIYKLKDLTVKSYVDLAHRIGQASSEAKAHAEDEQNEDDVTDDENIASDEDEDEDEEDSDSDLDAQKSGKGRKHKGGKKHKHKKNKKGLKVWLHFLEHAFVSTRTKEELKKL